MKPSNEKTSSQSVALTLLGVITAILTLLLIPLWSSGQLHYVLHSNYERLRSYMTSSPDATWCVMYDKPPRTGSTTILGALRRCWMSHRYKLHSNKRQKNNASLSFIGQTFDTKQPRHRYAIAGNHFPISHDDVQLIRQRCTHMLYVTSTREMRGRIVSKAKYELSKAKVDINTTLSAEEMKEALQKAVRDAETTEQQLERYPFIGGAYIAPDYVIRHDTLVEDLRLLLQAFECRTNFGSRNMHSVEADNKGEYNDDGDSEGEDEDNGEGEDETLSKELDVPLTMKDKRHRRMLEYARRLNRVGLERAVKFRNVDSRSNRKD